MDRADVRTARVFKNLELNDDGTDVRQEQADLTALDSALHGFNYIDMLLGNSARLTFLQFDDMTRVSGVKCSFVCSAWLSTYLDTTLRCPKGGYSTKGMCGTVVKGITPPLGQLVF